MMLHEMSSDRVTCMRRALRRRPVGHSVALVATAACLVTGCGGGGSATATNTAEAHALSQANAICREYNASIYAGQGLEDQGHAGSGPESFLAHKEAKFARLREVMSPASELPGVGAYISDLEGQGRLLAALRQAVGKGYAAYLRLALSESYRDESRKLDARVAADEKALGLTDCTRRQPRTPIAG